MVTMSGEKILEDRNDLDPEEARGGDEGFEGIPYAGFGP